MTAPGSTADAYRFDALDTPVVGDGSFSIGSYLAAQRRLRGMSLDELESVTRIPRRSLARLESGAFDRQQDAFVRGFVRTVALAIGLDPGDTLVRMLTAEAARELRPPLLGMRRVGFVLGCFAFFAVTSGLVLLLAERIELSGVRAAVAAPAPLSVPRRDYVRELAELVRSAPPGSFSRPAPMEAPPRMFIAPELAEIPLDAVFARPGVDEPAPAAVSGGVE